MIAPLKRQQYSGFNSTSTSVTFSRGGRSHRSDINIVIISTIISSWILQWAYQSHWQNQQTIIKATLDSSALVVRRRFQQLNHVTALAVAAVVVLSDFDIHLRYYICIFFLMIIIIISIYNDLCIRVTFCYTYVYIKLIIVYHTDFLLLILFRLLRSWRSSASRLIIFNAWKGVFIGVWVLVSTPILLVPRVTFRALTSTPLLGGTTLVHWGYYLSTY